jgi:hypothetical protein
LLLAILRTIQRKKPLGDQEADETISAVRDVEFTYAGTQTLDPSAERYPSYLRRAPDE